MNTLLSSTRFVRPSLLPLVGAIAVLACATARAGVLTAVGTDLNDPSWRTNTVNKPLDNNGDNIYGTNGYFLPRFNSATGTVAFVTTTTNGTINTLPSYLTIASAGGATGPDSAYGGKFAIDNPTAAGTALAGIAFHNNTANPAGANAFLTFTIGTGVPTATMRIGILSDTSSGGNLPTNFTLAQTTGTGTGTVTLNDATPAAAQADWYFFDIAGAAVGDVYTLSIGSTAASSKPTISGITLDVVPEPSTWALMFAGAVGFAGWALRRGRAV